MKTKTDFLECFFLEIARFDYFVYGEYQNLPYSNGESDIDIVVQPQDIQSFITVLNQLIRDNGLLLVSYYRNKTTYFIRILSPQKWGVQFDITQGFYHKGQVYYPLKYIKKNIILHNDKVKVLNIQTGYFIDFLKEVVTIGKAKKKYIDGFIKEYTLEPSRRKELQELYGRALVQHIDTALETGNLQDRIDGIQKQIRKKIHHRDLFNRMVMRLLSFRRIFLPPGYVIAVLGTDGSGKSTLIQAITPILNEAFHNGIIYEHLRPNVFPELGILVGKKQKRPQNVVVTAPHAEPPSGWIGSLGRWGYYLLDYTVGYIFKVFSKTHTKSKVFIFDRYYYDYYIDQKRFKIHLPYWIIRLGEIFIPTPDLILCLGGDPQKIYERKPETSVEEVKKQTLSLQAFCHRRKKAVWIDTCSSPEESVNAAMHAICCMMNKRFANKKIK